VDGKAQRLNFADHKTIGDCAEGLVQVFVHAVKQLLQILSFVLALVWVPITSHCSWESAIGGDFFKCTPAAEKGDCSGAGDDCASVESPSYKVPDAQADVVPFAFLFSAEVLALGFPADDQPCAAVTTPPEIPSSWQFHFRTALPPRAPSFVS
jgi:hypothetical protein